MAKNAKPGVDWLLLEARRASWWRALFPSRALAGLRQLIAHAVKLYAGLAPASQAGVLLGILSFTGMGLVGLTHWLTASIIAEQERSALLQSLHALVPATQHDNDMLADTLELAGPGAAAAAGPITVYRARKDGRPVAAVLTAAAPDGYNGTIRLLVAVRQDGTLAGARVVAHKETPGLGDLIEEAKSDWICVFSGRSLTDPDEKRWAVKRDGGAFDQFTGATITPRAVVRAVYRSLVYFRDHQDELLAAGADPRASGGTTHD